MSKIKEKKYETYKEMYKKENNKDLIFQKRLEMVKMGNEIGYKPTARKFKTDRNTVRKWCRRYNTEGIDGLKDKPRGFSKVG